MAACAAAARVGRRAALVLLTPVMTAMLANTMPGRLPSVAEAAFFYGPPLVLLLATGGLPRRVGRRPDAPVT
jgi:hypothetical protein